MTSKGWDTVKSAHKDVHKTLQTGIRGGTGVAKTAVKTAGSTVTGVARSASSSVAKPLTYLAIAAVVVAVTGGVIYASTR
jgi:uncharacterized membrane protein